MMKAKVLKIFVINKFRTRIFSYPKHFVCKFCMIPSKRSEKREGLVLFSSLLFLLDLLFFMGTKLEHELLCTVGGEVETIDTMPLSFLDDGQRILGVLDEELRHIGMNFLVIQWIEHRITSIEHMACDFLSFQSVVARQGQRSQYFLVVVHKNKEKTSEAGLSKPYKKKSRGILTRECRGSLFII